MFYNGEEVNVLLTRENSSMVNLKGQILWVQTSEIIDTKPEETESEEVETEEKPTTTTTATRKRVTSINSSNES